ncbi:Cutinase [Venustampulla echinocandica]|uniref:Cutinase n=1 Tax=Venustampulla echinocandica TaxID=2656787 RepID=A0A370TP23_9HELO|nr:Cutinase [Venustampulla echinocandica]RDL37274.1 Cutinase [Venustampulla echinocandica]
MRFNSVALLTLLGLAVASPVPAPVAEPLEKRDAALNAFLTVLLQFLPAVDGTISAVSGILTSFEQLVAGLTGEKTTYNELGGACKPYTVIFARGTTEPGNVGILVGPPFFSALKSRVGKSSVTIQGVNNYGASVQGYLAGGDPNGGPEMARQIEAARKACPNTKLIAGGYSQGGQIVHNAAKLLSADTAQWISKVVIFGDPFNGQAFGNIAASKTKVFCNQFDNICVNGDLILPAHLRYCENADAASAFVAS